MLKNPIYKYSIKIKSDDHTAVYCLRAIAKFAQRTGNNNIPVGGTSDEIWRKNGNTVIFRFTSIEFRNLFKTEVKRLLSNDFYCFLDEDDNNPVEIPN